MKKNFVIVTGGAGFIGSHACKLLSSIGYIPVTVDNLATGWEDAVKFGPLEKVDLIDKTALSLVFRKYNPIAVMHFACLSEVTQSVNHPILYWKNNVFGSLNLLEAAIENDCLNFVFSSTCAIFGDQERGILHEWSTQKPISPYGTSKLAVEKMIADFEVAYGLRYVILRYFNVAGADPEGEIGEYHRPETHLIPSVLNALLARKEEITIFGTNYETPDGTCIRDYVHVCDVVDAHILSLNWLQNKKASRVFNLGTGDGFSVREVIEQSKLVTNRSISIVEGNRRLGDCSKLVSGSKRAITELGWSAYRSELKQMITDAWQWHQNKNYHK